MKIGEFVRLLNTTKDTVRHYEELNLITPQRQNNTKVYGEKEILDFQVVKELQEYHFTLKDVQMLFQIKHSLACGDKQLINQVYENLMAHVDKLRLEEKDIRNRRLKLEEDIMILKDLL